MKILIVISYSIHLSVLSAVPIFILCALNLVPDWLLIIPRIGLSLWFGVIATLALLATLKSPAAAPQPDTR